MPNYKTPKSGQICSESGLWVTIGPEKEKRQIQCGEEIPYVGKKPKRWRLLVHL